MPKATETTLEIDLNALRHNYQYLNSKLDKNTKFMAVVKAYAYGSDTVAIAKELVALGVDYFAVAYVSEGVQLRNSGIETPILVLHPQPSNFEEIIERCLEPAIYSSRILKSFIELAENKSQKNYPVHLKFNTGLNRLGLGENDTQFIIEELSKTDSVTVKSLFSHLAASEDHTERDFTLGQINSFKKISKEMIQKLKYTPLLHQSNTSGILNYPESEFDMVRSGIGLYGYGNDPVFNEALKPVFSLKSVISQLHKIETNESVGYNRAYIAKKPEVTATIPIGHADGISRAYGNEVGWVTIGGKKAPIVGNVCMDMIMVNVTNIDCKEGDEVIIFGKETSAETLSKAINSIPYELLTAISQRIKRVVCRK